MNLARRVRRLEHAEGVGGRGDHGGGGCACKPATCDVLRPDPPYSDCYPDRPHVACPRCGRPAIRIVIRYDKVPTPPKSG